MAEHVPGPGAPKNARGGGGPDGRGRGGAGRLRRVGRSLGGLAFFLLLVLAAGEIGLQIAARFVGDRAGEWRPRSSVRILAVGDSHTYGAGVKPKESYPARLQALLDRHAPRRYSVINLGVPGLSTTQVRNRLPANVAHYEPDLVIVWAGVNNAWNYSELGDRKGGVLARLDALGARLRFYRLGRVWWHDREIERAAGTVRADGSAQPLRIDWTEAARARFTLKHRGIAEEITNHRGPLRVDAAMEERAVEDLGAIVAWLRSASVDVVLVRYSMNLAAFARANAAIDRVASNQGVPVVNTTAALQRIPRGEQAWLPGHHPDPRLYREIAREALPVVFAVSEPDVPPPRRLEP